MKDTNCIHTGTYLSLDAPIKQGLKLLLVVIAAVALMACGGGGGGVVTPSDNGGSTTPPIDEPEDDGSTVDDGSSDGSTPSTGGGSTTPPIDEPEDNVKPVIPEDPEDPGSTPSTGGDGSSDGSTVGDGSSDGSTVGDGSSDGSTVGDGSSDGSTVGDGSSDGSTVGDGSSDGSTVGDGSSDGSTVGDGSSDGSTVGDGSSDGSTVDDGSSDGSTVGDGSSDGSTVGDGSSDGSTVGDGSSDGSTVGDGSSDGSTVGDGSSDGSTVGDGSSDGSTVGDGSSDGSTVGDGSSDGSTVDDGSSDGSTVGDGSSDDSVSSSQIRIGIHDTGVDINHASFTDWIAASGGNYLYPTTYTPTSSDDCVTQSSENLCLYYIDPASPYRIELPPACIGSGADRQACARAMLEGIQANTIPADGDLTLYIYDRTTQIIYRLPTATELEHGTTVASLAMESASGSTADVVIVPITIQVNRDPLPDDASLTFNNLLEGVSDYDIDVLNRSFGIATATDPADSNGYIDAVDSFRSSPSGSSERNYWEAFAQIDVDPADKTVQVWASGNEGDTRPNQTSILPHYYPELRDHWVAVAATGSAGAIASYSNHCGVRTATDVAWDEAEYGLHYCISALGEGDGAALPNGNTRSGGLGTSYAAPRVTGAIAAVMGNARGQVRAVEALSRIKQTADRSGIYADETIYGVGLLDMDAALDAIGTTTLSAANGLGSSLNNALLRTHAAYGAAAVDGLRGVEIAAFDQLNYPFWQSASTLVKPTVVAIPPLLLNDKPVPIEQVGLLRALRWLDVSGERHWSLRLALTETSFGISGAPFSDKVGALSGLRFGFVGDSETHHGVRSTGAFGSAVRSGLVFAGFDRTWHSRPPSRWSLHSRVLFAVGKPDYEQGALFTASGSLYSSAALELQYARKQHRTRVRIEQPLRAESGQGVLHYPYGRTPEGAPLYRKHTFSLVPGARAIHIGLRHDRTIGAGQFTVELLHIINQGHVNGNQYAQISTAYRLDW